MGSLTEFLLLNDHSTEQTDEVVLVGFNQPFKIRTISEERNVELKKQATKIVKGGRFRGTQRDLDINLYNALLVAECTLDPNFKNAELQEKFGVPGSVDKLIWRILTPGQFDILLEAIFTLNGFVDDEFAEKKEEVKNA